MCVGCGNGDPIWILNLVDIHSSVGVMMEMENGSGDVRSPRRSLLAMVVWTVVVLLLLAGGVGLVWAKNTGTPITADKPYYWDGRSNIMIVYHAEYELGDDTCKMSALDGDRRDVQFQQEHASDEWLRVNGEFLEGRSYGYPAVITCAKDGDRVLTGFGAVGGRSWMVGPLLAAFLLLSSLGVYLFRNKYEWMAQGFHPQFR